MDWRLLMALTAACAQAHVCCSVVECFTRTRRDNSRCRQFGGIKLQQL